jgi:hypothetical protein
MKYEYKYTLGTWDRVEVNAIDSNIQNRSFISGNGINVLDTVKKWKQAKPSQQNSLQLQKINAMKDSVLTKIQPGLNEMLELLKIYVQNLLKENPERSLHNKLDKKAIKRIGYAYEQITDLLWNVMTSLTKEQKLLIQRHLDEPAGKEDFLNTFFRSFNTVMEQNK